MLPISDLSQLDPNGTYTYADYLTWRFEQAVELIKGRVFPMTPAPNLKHQRISWHLSGEMWSFFKAKPCSAFSAPFDVRLYNYPQSAKANKDIYTVVQPDICIICDAEKLDEKGCIGAPDLIVEILSKGNSAKEMKIKYELYQESDVKEYWVIYPYEEILQQFILNEKQVYQLHKTYVTEDIVCSFIFPELAISLTEIFAD